MFRETIASTFYRNNHNHHIKKNTSQHLNRSAKVNHWTKPKRQKQPHFFLTPNLPKFSNHKKWKKKVTFCIGRLWVGSFYTVKGAVLLFCENHRNLTRARSHSHTTLLEDTLTHTQSHTITLHNCLYLLNETKQKNACLNTIISLYTDTDLCCCW